MPQNSECDLIVGDPDQIKIKDGIGKFLKCTGPNKCIFALHHLYKRNGLQPNVRKNPDTGV